MIANHQFKVHFTIILSYRRLRFGTRSSLLFVFELLFFIRRFLCATLLGHQWLGKEVHPTVYEVRICVGCSGYLVPNNCKGRSVSVTLKGNGSVCKGGWGKLLWTSLEHHPTTLNTATAYLRQDHLYPTWIRTGLPNAHHVSSSAVLGVQFNSIVWFNNMWQ